MSKLVQAYDLAEYEDFINQEQFAGRPLAEYVAEVQRIYCADKRPWVIGYSGGKDSSAVITLVYLALLSLFPEPASVFGPLDPRSKPKTAAVNTALPQTA